MFFLNQLFTTARSFSSSALQSFPKLKSHNGAKKRWRSLSNGKFKRAHAYHKHMNVNKSPAQKNRLQQSTYSSPTQTAILKKLLPYGSP